MTARQAPQWAAREAAALVDELAYTREVLADLARVAAPMLTNGRGRHDALKAAQTLLAMPAEPRRGAISVLRAVYKYVDDGSDNWTERDAVLGVLLHECAEAGIPVEVVTR